MFESVFGKLLTLLSSLVSSLTINILTDMGSLQFLYRYLSVCAGFPQTDTWMEPFLPGAGLLSKNRIPLSGPQTAKVNVMCKLIKLR